MKKKLIRPIAWLMIACMLLTIMPITIWAETSVENSKCSITAGQETECVLTGAKGFPKEIRITVGNQQASNSYFDAEKQEIHFIPPNDLNPGDYDILINYGENEIYTITAGLEVLAPEQQNEQLGIQSESIPQVNTPDESTSEDEIVQEENNSEIPRNPEVIIDPIIIVPTPEEQNQQQEQIEAPEQPQDIQSNEPIMLLQGEDQTVGTISGYIQVPSDMLIPDAGIDINVKAFTDSEASPTSSTTINITRDQTLLVPFTLTEIPEGDYYVSYTIETEGIDGFDKGYFDGSTTVSTFEQANSISVTAAGVNNVYLYLLKGTTISGMITIPQSVAIPVEGVKMDLYAAAYNDKEFYKQVTIFPSATGDHTANYTLRVENYYYYRIHYEFATDSNIECIESGYLDRWTDSITNYADIYPFYAEAAGVSKNILIPEGALLSGKVTIPDGITMPATGLSLGLNISGYTWFDNSITLNFTESKREVSYSLRVLPDQSYSVAYELKTDIQGVSKNGYYSPNGTSLNNQSQNILVNQDTSGINLELLEISGINGTITIPSNITIPVGGMGVTVIAYKEQSWDLIASTHMIINDAETAIPYTLANIPSGSYYVYFTIDNTEADCYTKGYYSEDGTVYEQSEADRVQVPPTGEGSIDMTLVKGAVISGKVTLSQGITMPVEGLSMSVNISNNNGLYYHTYLNFAQNEYEKTYSVRVKPGQRYSLQYNVDQEIPGIIRYGYYTDDGISPAYQEPNLLIDGDTTDINLIVMEGITINGTIKLGQAQSMNLSMNINAMQLVGDKHQYLGNSYVSFISYQTNGSYSMTLPKNGDYIIGYNIYGEGTNLVKNGYYSTTGLVGINEAETIPVAESNISLNDMTIPVASQIKGTITLAEPSPVAFDMQITAEEDGYPQYTYVPVALGSTSIDYTLNVRPNVDYIVGYKINYSNENLRYIQQGYYSNSGTVNYDYADYINVSGDSVDGIDINIETGSVIKGIVSLPEGINSSGMISVNINAEMSEYDNYYETRAEIPSGKNSAPYYLVVKPTPDYPDEGNPNYNYQLWYSYYKSQTVNNQTENNYVKTGFYSAGGTTANYNDITPINASTDISDIDFQLIQGVELKGRIVIENGELAPVNGLEINVSPHCGTSSMYSNGYSVYIPEGQNYKDFTLIVQPNQQYKIRYSIKENEGATPYAKTGYLGNITTTTYASPDVRLVDVGSDALTLDKDLVIRREKTISGTISLPEGNFAPIGGMKLQAYATPEGGGQNYYTDVFIPANGTTVNYTIDVLPDVSYRIRYSINYGNSENNYIWRGYYSAVGTTDIYDDADVIDVIDSNVSGKDLAILKNIITKLVVHEFPQNPQESLNGTSYGANFDIKFKLENGDLTKVDLNNPNSYSFRLNGRYDTSGSYKAFTLKQDATDESILIASFAGVQAGTYQISSTWIRYTDGKTIWCNNRDLIEVDSYQSKAVVYRYPQTNRAEGYSYYGLDIRGYNLDKLVKDGWVDAVLKDGGNNIVAKTAPTGKAAYYNLWHSGKGMHITLGAVDEENGLQPGEYRLVFNNDNWSDSNISLRLQPGKGLVVTAEPFISDSINTWDLGAGASNYRLQVDGSNLDQLEAGKTLAFELLDADGNRHELADAIILSEGNNDVAIAADFIKVLPLEPGPYMTLNIGYKNGDDPVIPLLGGAKELSLIDYETLHGNFIASSNLPNTTYTITYKGWNLKSLYTLNLSRYNESTGELETIKTIANKRPINDKELIFNLTFTEKLLPGEYHVNVDSEETGGWSDNWRIEEPERYIRFTNIPPDKTYNELSDSLGVDFTVNLQTFNTDSVNLAESEVWLEGREGFNGSIPAALSIIPGINDQFTANFIGIKPGIYQVVARLKCDGNDIWQGVNSIIVESYNNISVVNEQWPNTRPTGEEYIWVGIRGYNLKQLIQNYGEENSYVNAVLKDLQGNEVATTMPTDEQNFNSYNEDGDDVLDLYFKTYLKSGLNDGLYTLSFINATGWDETKSYRAPLVRVSNQPFVDDWLNTNQIGVNENNYTLSVHGANLDLLNNTRTVVFQLRSADPDVTFETTALANWDKDEHGYTTISANFNNATSKLPENPTKLMLMIGYQLPTGTVEPIPGGIFSLDVIEYQQVYNFTSNTNAPKNQYNVTFDGWNLDGEYKIELKKFNEDNKEWETLYTKYQTAQDDNKISTTLDLDESLLEGNYQVEVTKGDFWWNTEWEIRVPGPYFEFLGDLDGKVITETVESKDGSMLEVKLQTSYMKEFDYVRSVVVLEGNNGTNAMYHAVLTFDETTEIATAIFTGVQPGKYALHGVLFKQGGYGWGEDVAPIITFKSFEDKAIVTKLNTKAIPAGITQFWVNVGGSGLDNLISYDGAMQFVNAELIDAATKEVKAVTTVGSRRLNMNADAKGNWIDIEFHATGNNGMEEGNYEIKVNHPDWSNTSSYRVEPIKATALTHLKGWLRPFTIAAGEKMPRISAEGFNLDGLDLSKVEFVLYERNYKRYLATDVEVARSIGLVQRVIYDFNYKHGELSAEFDYTTPTTNQDFVMDILYNGQPIPGGEKIFINSNSEPAITGSEINYDAINVKILLSGINLDNSPMTTYMAHINKNGQELPAPMPTILAAEGKLEILIPKPLLNDDIYGRYGVYVTTGTENFQVPGYENMYLADNRASISISNAIGATGNKVEVKVSGQELEGVAGMQFVLEYNPSVVQIESQEDIQCLIEGWFPVINMDNKEDGSIIITCGDLSGTNVIDQNSQDLFSIKFKILGEQGTLSYINIFELDNVLIFDKDSNEIEAIVNGGKIESNLKYGDLTRDGSLNMADVIYIARSIVGINQLDSNQRIAADVNGDQSIDIQDAMYMMNRISRKITKFPVE